VGTTRRGERITGVGVGCADDRRRDGGAAGAEGCRVEGAVEAEEVRAWRGRAREARRRALRQERAARWSSVVYGAGESVERGYAEAE